MNIQLNKYNSGITLVGVIVGIMLIIIGVIVITLLARAARIPPRELPDYAAEAMNRSYPGYETNYAQRLWPVHFVPTCLDIVTPDPNAYIYEKVFLDNTFLVDICRDGSLTNWETQFQWIVGGSSLGNLQLNQNGIPLVRGFNEYSKDGITYKMNKNYSGIDIQLSEEVKRTNKIMFWKVRKVD